MLDFDNEQFVFAIFENGTPRRCMGTSEEEEIRDKVDEEICSSEVEKELSAPDRGWGWLVVFSSLVIHIILCIGGCLVYTPSVVIVGQYFSRRRGLAVGIATSSFGSFLFPTLIEFLFDYYGFTGAFIVPAGIALNITVCGSVFRPPQQHKSKTKFMNGKESPLSCRRKAGKPRQPSTYLCSKTCTTMSNYKCKLMGILGDYRFTTFCFAISMFSIAFHSAYAFIPLYAAQIGIDDRQSTYIVAVTILADGIGRIGIGAVLDVKCIRHYRIMLYSISLLLVGVASLSLPWTRTFLELGVVGSVYGGLMGGIISQKSVIVVDILGVKHLADAFGMLSLFQGIGVFIGPPISGLLRDLKGDYSDGFYFGGGVTVAGAAIFIMANVMYLFKKKHINSSKV